MKPLKIKPKLQLKFSTLYELCSLERPKNGIPYVLKDKLYVLAYDHFNTLTLDIQKEIIDLKELSFVTFAKRLYELIIISKEMNQSLDKKIIETFLNDLLNEFPIKEYQVYAPIWGISFPIDKKEIILGDYEISRRGVKFQHNDDDPYNSVINYFIRAAIKSRDDHHLNELANEKFSIFENAIRVVAKLCGDLSTVSISEMDSQNILRYFQYPDGILSKSQISYVAFINEIDLSKKNISDVKYWKIISNPIADMDKRLYRAINWLGKSLIESDRHISFIQCFFCIESLLQKNETFGPSVTHRISEFICFLLKEDKDDRLNLFKEVKDLYDIRSQIAHGTSMPNILYSQKIILTNICLQLIRHLLDESDKFQTYSDLENYIIGLRFS